jgi:hypothetical protein
MCTWLSCFFLLLFVSTLFDFLNILTLFYFYSLGLVLHDDAGRPILSRLLFSQIPITSLNPGLGRVRTSSLNPDFGRVHARSLICVDYLTRPRVYIFTHPLFIFPRFTFYVRCALGNHLSQGHRVCMYGYCGTPLAAFRYDPYCTGGIWLLYTGGGGGYWFPLLGALCAAFARIDRRSDSSPSDIIPFRYIQ